MGKLLDPPILRSRFGNWTRFPQSLGRMWWKRYRCRVRIDPSRISKQVSYYVLPLLAVGAALFVWWRMEYGPSTKPQPGESSPSASPDWTVVRVKAKEIRQPGRNPEIHLDITLRNDSRHTLSIPNQGDFLIVESYVKQPADRDWQHYSVGICGNGGPISSRAFNPGETIELFQRVQMKDAGASMMLAYWSRGAPGDEVRVAGFKIPSP